MKNSIRIRENKLSVNNCLPIVFEEDICGIVDMEDIVIVLTIPKKGFLTINRIYGVSDGAIIWRVQDMLEYKEGYSNYAPDPYTGIRIFEKDESIIVGTTSYGFRMLIDPQTGKIVGTDGWTK